MRIIGVVLAAALCLAHCGIYAEPDVRADSPVYAQAAGSHVLAWGHARNIGAATAKNCRMALLVFAGEKLIESHNKPLGDIEPDEKVKFEIVLDAVKYGDDVGYQTKYFWD